MVEGNKKYLYPHVMRLANSISLRDGIPRDLMTLKHNESISWISLIFSISSSSHGYRCSSVQGHKQTLNFSICCRFRTILFITFNEPHEAYTKFVLEYFFKIFYTNLTLTLSSNIFELKSQQPLLPRTHLCPYSCLLSIQ